MKALVGAFNQEKALILFVIVKTDGSFSASSSQDAGHGTSSAQTWNEGRKVEDFIVSLVSNLQPLDMCFIT